MIMDKINTSYFKKGHKHSENWYKSMKTRVPWNKGLHVNLNPKGGFKKGHAVWNKGIHTGIKPWLDKKRPEMTAEKHPNWKGGTMTHNQIERTRFRQTIQKQVFERDNYTCQMCGQRGGKLQVDHIQPWAEYVELRFSMDNCRTLCMGCHYLITYGKPKPKEIKTWGHNLRKEII